MRLIDADALDLDREVELADDWKTAHEIANCVKYAPTVDAVPVVHGRWIKGGYACGENEYKCSACGETEWRTGCARMKYCMCCGARMDSEEHHD